MRRRHGATTGEASMSFFDGAMGLVVLAPWAFCLIDVISTDEWRCRNVPKTYWVLLVLLLFDLGAIVWLVAGRPWPDRSRPGPGAGSAYPEYDRPGRFAATHADDDDDFLRQCRER